MSSHANREGSSDSTDTPAGSNTTGTHGSRESREQRKGRKAADQLAAKADLRPTFGAQSTQEIADFTDALIATRTETAAVTASDADAGLIV